MAAFVHTGAKGEVPVMSIWFCAEPFPINPKFGVIAWVWEVDVTVFVVDIVRVEGVPNVIVPVVVMGLVPVRPLPIAIDVTVPVLLVNPKEAGVIFTHADPSHCIRFPTLKYWV